MMCVNADFLMRFGLLWDDEMTPIITRETTVRASSIIKADLEYHFGDASTYDFKALSEVIKSSVEPDKVFACFSVGQKTFYIGERYQRCCAFLQDQIEIVRDLESAKNVRNIETINREFRLLDPEAVYAFNMQDALRINYKEIFSTQGELHVFQSHRRRGLKAIILPLIYYHEEPNWNIPRLKDSVSFSEKQPKAFWRGDLSGEVATPWGFRGIHQVVQDESFGDDERLKLILTCPRFKLCYENRQNDFIDCGLVIKWGTPEYPNKTPLLESVSKDRATRTEHMQYRYLLAIDGYDGPSSWYWMLNTNSVVLRQESDWEMFGDNYFHPWVHFVPLAADLGDLEDKLKWCETHQEECVRISANARKAWSVLFDSGITRERQNTIMSKYRELYFAR